MRLLIKAGFGVAFLLVIISVAPAVKADPIFVHSEGFALRGLGSTGPVVNNNDSLTGAAASSTHNINGNGSFFALLNPLTFATGFTGDGSEGSHDFSFSQLLTINGQTQVLNLGGRIDIGSVVDSVHVLSSAPLTYRFNGFSVDVNVVPAAISGGTDGVFCDVLRAAFTVRQECEPVPDPATLTLLGLGVAGLAAKFSRRRKLSN